MFSACVKDKPNTTIAPSVQLSNNKKVYVVNEGVYPTGTAEVSLYDPSNGAVIEKFYNSQNNEAVGDVAQNLISYNHKFYLVVNNSNKIIVCNEQFKKIAQINALNSPRYILPITNSKAYVSDLYANAISIVDLNTNTITGSIPCSGWTEKMVLSYNKAFVTNMKRNYVYVINTITNIKTDSILVGSNAGSVVIDRNDKIWVLSAGTQSAGIAGSLKKINPVTNSVESDFVFSTGDSPNNLCLNKTKDTLYFLNKGIYKMPINATAIPNAAIIDNGNKNFYGLGINPNDFTIYVSDALDYIQKSNVYIFDANGNQKSFFKAGINANGFYFE